MEKQDFSQYLVLGIFNKINTVIRLKLKLIIIVLIRLNKKYFSLISKTTPYLQAYSSIAKYVLRFCLDTKRRKKSRKFNAARPVRRAWNLIDGDSTANF